MEKLLSLYIDGSKESDSNTVDEVMIGTAQNRMG